MLRITFIAPFGLRQKTTVWARTLPLARFLAAQGHTVMGIIPPWDSPEDARKGWVDQGVQVVNVSLAGGLPAITARMMNEVDTFQPQIIHIVKPRAHAGLVQWLLWQRRRVLGTRQRILLDVDDWEQAWAAINHYPPLVARFLAWQEEWGIRHADGITAASHWLVERVQHYTPQTPVCYLPNGVTAPDDCQLPESPVASLEKGVATEQVLFFSRYVEGSRHGWRNFGVRWRRCDRRRSSWFSVIRSSQNDVPFFSSVWKWLVQQRQIKSLGWPTMQR